MKQIVSLNVYPLDAEMSEGESKKIGNYYFLVLPPSYIIKLLLHGRKYI